MEVMHNVKFFMGVCFIVLVSMVQSCTEMRLSLFGRRTSAEVEQVLIEVNSKTNQSTGTYGVDYHFQVTDGDKRGSYQGRLRTNESEAEAASASKRLEVLYLPSSPMTHRVAGHRNVIWVLIFLAVLIFAIINGMMVWKQAQEDVRRSKR